MAKRALLGGAFCETAGIITFPLVEKAMAHGLTGKRELLQRGMFWLHASRFTAKLRLSRKPGNDSACRHLRLRIVRREGDADVAMKARMVQAARTEVVRTSDTHVIARFIRLDQRHLVKIVPLNAWASRIQTG